MRNLLLTLLLAFTGTAAHAQYPPIWFPLPPPRPAYRTPPPPSNFTFGATLSLGLENHDDHTQTDPVSVPLFGLFADFTHHAVRPGIDLRAEAGRIAVRGLLVGPRVSYNYRTLHPYAAGLFGPNHYGDDSSILIGAPSTANDHHGVTAKLAVGIDSEISSYVCWRVVEYSLGNFNGIPNSHPQTFSTGIVFRIP
jgi:hypothetical protein